MDNIDKNYLRVQFWLMVHKKIGTEFQSFFEDIMEKAFSDFQKIRPNGNDGDGGNDGYRPSKGIYYQVYAPLNPNEKESTAARKLKDDFYKLQSNWNEISKIKTYYFVFNDNGYGVIKKIEKALSELRHENPNIDFKKFIPKDLENVFFTLKNDQILALGFDVDSTKAIGNAYELMSKLEIDLDRQNGQYVSKALETIKPIISNLQDEDLELTYEILECRTLHVLEKIIEAKKKYENLCKRYPNDPRAFLYLAEIYLINEDYKKNEELLNKAEKIDNKFWLLALEKLVREWRLRTEINVLDINEQTFPKDPRIKANFYRLYSFFLEQAGEQTKAESFIEKAIHLNPDKFHNYDAKLTILESRIFSQHDDDEEKFQKDVRGFLDEIRAIEQITSEWGDLSPRCRVILNFRKFNVFHVLGNGIELDDLLKETFELIMQCYFDQLIDQLLAELLIFIDLPRSEFERLLKYLQASEKTISDKLARAIALQFNLKKNLLTEGKEFFKTIKKHTVLSFIENVENKNYDQAWNFLNEDLRFAIAIANTAKDLPDLRRIIIEKLPDDKNIQKEKLLLLLNYDEGNIDEAFELLKNLDLSDLNYFECKPILKIANEKKAWDFAIKILKKLLKHEKDNSVALQLKLQLFSANLNLDRFLDAIQIGEMMLSDNDEMKLLDDKNKESLLWNTLVARLKRGEYPEARILLENCPSFPKSFEFNVGIEPQVYIKNNEALKALSSIVEGVKTLKNPTPEQYGNLFFVFIEISNMTDFQLTPQKKIEDNCFVKLKNQVRWYFVGNNNELDASKISGRNDKYSVFINKEVGDKIVLDDSYRSENPEFVIEDIQSIEKYIFIQSNYHAKKLTSEHRWDQMEMIEIPRIGATIDTKYLIARLEDEKKKRENFFKLYCEQKAPLALLAVNEGGLANAIGCIVNENRGFVNFSSGDLKEFDSQIYTAKKIIDGDLFYIDGTSALVLSETGLLVKLYNHLPNLRVPQSVITLLLETKDKFSYVPGQAGHMSLTKGRISFSNIDLEKSDAIRENFVESIKILESKPENIIAISTANKIDCFSEQKVPAGLCDACIIAQKDEAIVLTEDFLYLKANELETKKSAPEYCSAFALVRALHDKKIIDFDQYLNFFSYLSSYRFRFLAVTIDDIEKAVFGDGVIKTIRPERIRHFNFPLTLSEEYGVTFENAFTVIGIFLTKILVDDAILPEKVERIFAEILSSFPTDRNKRELGQLFLRTSVEIINKRNIVGMRTREKVDILRQFTEVFHARNNLWTP